MNAEKSAKLSLALCIVSSVLLLCMVIFFPQILQWLYVGYHHLPREVFVTQRVAKAVIPAFYGSVPFAAASLYMLIRLLCNILHKDIFVRKNVVYLRLISWCCYAVLGITGGFAVRYVPLVVIAVAMGIVGTLLRVVKNIMQAAVELREENDLTI